MFDPAMGMEKKQCSDENVNFQNIIIEQINQSILQLCQYYEQQLKQSNFSLTYQHNDINIRQINNIDLSNPMFQNNQLQQFYNEQEIQKQQLTQQNAQLTSQVKSLQTKLRGEEEERERLETEKQTNTKKSTTTINQLKQENLELTERLQELEFDCRKKDEKFLYVSKQLNELQESISNLNNSISQLKQQLAKKESELTVNNGKITDADNVFKDFMDEKNTEVMKLQFKISLLKNELDEKNQLLKKHTQESQARFKALEEEFSKENQNFLQSKEEVSNQIKQEDQNIDDLQKYISLLKQDIKKLQKLNKSYQDYQNLQEIENFQPRRIIEKIQNYVKNLSVNLSVANYDDDINDLKRIINKMMQKIEDIQKPINQQQIQQNLAALERDKENQMKKNLDGQKQRAQKLLERKNSNKMLIKQLMSKAIEVLGQLDICYVIDSTASMEPYIQQARKCVRETLKIIKYQTNRDTNVSAVCYYDIEQKPKTGFYHQLDFTKNAQELENFLDQMKTAGGRDTPEDVKGAFDQMLSNIKWKNKFRLAILITDAPCHGEKYHEPMNDYHKDSDIASTLHNIVKNGIILIGFNLNRYTTKMYKEFEKVYKEIQKQDQFFMVDVTGQQIDKLAEQMAKTLGQASEQATQVKNTGTKSKKAQQERPYNRDGAMEALCKCGNFYNFEQQENVKVVDANFKVLKVEIVDGIFEENFQTINNIGKSQDHYEITDEGMWQCIRTDQPFAFGEMKDVFLMKKKNQIRYDELFIIKTPIGGQPYKTQNDAINECRSHLICQILVKKFRNEVEKAKEEINSDLYVPPVIYTDFLILQETNNRFWIAEKFLNGEFVKYNNNFGFINPEYDPLNKFAQAFSYYTFFISRGKYLVNNVQGVGIYFTDPAINTETGDFDDTDLGLEGQQMFLVSFELKHQLASDYMKILDIHFEVDDGKKNK